MTARRGANKKVLVVEDSHITRNLIATAIEEGTGAKVIQADSGFSALKIIPAEGPFDLMVFDINMPDINGLELVRFVRQSEHLKHIPVIIVSTEGKETDIKRGFEAGANDYIVKPFRTEDLIEVVKKYLSGEK